MESEIVGEVGRGLVALVAVCADDTAQDIQWTADKIASLRIFPNRDATPPRHFDRDVREAGGAVLLVSNFTVAADTRKGRRPSLNTAAGPQRGHELFDLLVARMRAAGIKTATGRFGADMQIELVNDGPATFLLDSQEARVVD